ncbi:MAG: hypothetical protein ACHQQQ_06240 [Bacteroidota bacterium]
MYYDQLLKTEIKHRDKLLFILSLNNEIPKSTREIREFAFNNGLPEVQKWNIATLLKSAKKYAINLPEGWALTNEGRKYLENINLIDSKNIVVKNSINDLRKHLFNIEDKETIMFLEEAIKCLEIDLKRAAVVLSWSGAISLLYRVVVNRHLNTFNAEATRRDPKWRAAKNADDLSRMKEKDFLDILEAISVIGKNVKQELQNNCLQLRNACGHPNSLKIGERKVAAHIEILIMNVFSKLK